LQSASSDHDNKFLDEIFLSRLSTILKGMDYIKECGFLLVIRLKYVLEAKKQTAKLPLNFLKMQRRPPYLNTQSVPRCKHFSSRL
jgi:hypothetical protein